jgi:hypothetical protein
VSCVSFGSDGEALHGTLAIPPIFTYWQTQDPPECMNSHQCMAIKACCVNKSHLVKKIEALPQGFKMAEP